jgi:uncharacterized protein (DUF924 family)
MTLRPPEILDFWFGDDPSEHRKRWFETTAEFDTECGRFSAAIRAARGGCFDPWATAPRDGLALIILLDQLSRNVFRGTAEAFAADARAREIARGMIAAGFDTTLTPIERMFVYLPFQHAETIDDQNESVRLFETLTGLLSLHTIGYAHRHRDVIQRFGRFPRRNAALGRVNTPEETEYLAQPGGSF